MKTVTVRQVRHDFGSVLHLIEEGEEVEIKKRGKVVAVMQPPRPKKSRKVPMPDFAARAKRYCGDVFLTDKQAARLIAESRGDR